MFPQFQRVVTLSVMSILVGLFTWIYVRDRQPRARLWMIGWACIVAHFAGMLLFSFSLIPVAAGGLVGLLHPGLRPPPLSFFRFVRGRGTPRDRILFWAAIVAPAVAYWTCMVFEVAEPVACTAHCWRWCWARAYGWRCGSPSKTAGSLAAWSAASHRAGAVGRLAHSPPISRPASISSCSRALPSPAGAIGDTSAA